MKTYIVKILSFSSHLLNIVPSVLACPTLSKLIFPAVLPTEPGSGIRLDSAENFTESIIPKDFYTESLVNIPLISINGLEFSSTIYLKKTITPNVINLKFTSQHWEMKTITLTDLKCLFDEIIPAFKADYGSVYAEKSSSTASAKYIRTPEFRSYPLEIDWLTYMGSEMVSLLGRERLSALKTYAEKYDCYEGTIILLQEEPLCQGNPDHQTRQSQAQAELKLAELALS